MRVGRRRKIESILVPLHLLVRLTISVRYCCAHAIGTSVSQKINDQMRIQQKISIKYRINSQNLLVKEGANCRRMVNVIAWPLLAMPSPTRNNAAVTLRIRIISLPVAMLVTITALPLLVVEIGHHRGCGTQCCLPCCTSPPAVRLRRLK